MRSASRPPSASAAVLRLASALAGIVLCVADISEPVRPLDPATLDLDLGRSGAFGITVHQPHLPDRRPVPPAQRTDLRAQREGTLGQLAGALEIALQQRRFGALLQQGRVVGND